MVGILTVIAIIVLYFLKRPEKWVCVFIEACGYMKWPSIWCRGITGPEEPVGDKDKNKDSNGSQTKFSSSKVKSKGKYQPQKKKNILLEPHPYLAANFKGHIDTILLMSFEPGGKYLATLTKGKQQQQQQQQQQHSTYMNTLRVNLVGVDCEQI